MKRPPELRAEVHTPKGWQTLDAGWMVHWTIREPAPILYARAGDHATRITARWRVKRGTQLIASAQPEPLEA